MIILKPEHEQLIEAAMRTGAYQSPDEVIHRALEMLQSEEEWLQDEKNAIEAKIERGLEQFERGEFLSAEESRADLDRRKNEWLSNKRQ